MASNQETSSNQETEFVTYRLANGDQIWGEYAFVTGPEFFEELDEPVEVVMEIWVLKNSEVVTFAPLYWDEDKFDEMYDEAIEDGKIRRNNNDDNLSRDNRTVRKIPQETSRKP